MLSLNRVSISLLWLIIAIDAFNIFAHQTTAEERMFWFISHGIWLLEKDTFMWWLPDSFWLHMWGITENKRPYQDTVSLVIGMVNSIIAEIVRVLLWLTCPLSVSVSYPSSLLTPCVLPLSVWFSVLFVRLPSFRFWVHRAGQLLPYAVVYHPCLCYNKTPSVVFRLYGLLIFLILM